nr:uncharacterized protein LOC123762892 [Procambarus clarkii]
MTLMKWVAQGVFLTILCLAHGRESSDAKLLVAAYSTKTAYFLTTSTTTTPYTCAFKVQTQVCQRRRFKRYSSVDDVVVRDLSPLEGTLEDAIEGDAKNKRNPRIALTIWSTTTSTYTVTSTSINSATTFSLSFYCTVSGASALPVCG